MVNFKVHSQKDFFLLKEKMESAYHIYKLMRGNFFSANVDSANFS